MKHKIEDVERPLFQFVGHGMHIRKKYTKIKYTTSETAFIKVINSKACSEKLGNNSSGPFSLMFRVSSLLKRPWYCTNTPKEKAYNAIQCDTTKSVTV